MYQRLGSDDRQPVPVTLQNENRAMCKVSQNRMCYAAPAYFAPY